MKNRAVQRRKKRRTIAEWPAEEPPATVVAARVKYVGSAEHKDYPSPAGVAGLRSDASRCPPYPQEQWPNLQQALRNAVERECVSREFDIGGFPRYVWGFFEGQLFEARHLGNQSGEYKAYPLEEWERPSDPREVLNDG